MFWGRYFRILYELYVNFLLLTKRYDICFNFSNYGIGIFGKHLLYFHNQALLELNINSGFAQGKPNVIKRWMLNGLLKRAKCIVLQADHVNNKLKEYCSNFNLTYPNNVIIVRPNPFLKSFSKKGEKLFPFQLFYPSSNTLVKRDNLAVEAIEKYHKQNNRVGLVITSGSAVIESKIGVSVLNWLSREEVSSQLSICDALLFTSESETLGLPLLESLFFEKPAVLPDLPYARDIYGDAAVYFRNGNANEVAMAVNELIDHYEIYLERARERKKLEFSNRINWKEHWEIFVQNSKNQNNH